MQVVRKRAGERLSHDGWWEGRFDTLTNGDVEMLGRSYTVAIRRNSVMTDSGSIGKFRDGAGVCWKIVPLDRPVTKVAFGAKTGMNDPKTRLLAVIRLAEARAI